MVRLGAGLAGRSQLAVGGRWTPHGAVVEIGQRAEAAATAEHVYAEDKPQDQGDDHSEGTASDRHAAARHAPEAAAAL
ncbi:MAG: hypothetical protein JOZ98_10205 [Solirubrobacterales bacterium]|nr:hypothetical protein [Solirubrobacterales bacterium]MBV9796736.1 hypothetical protein [Solirubrobacterales bacterium]